MEAGLVLHLQNHSSHNVDPTLGLCYIRKSKGHLPQLTRFP